MKEKVDNLLSKPDLTMLEVQELYQELSSKQGKLSFADFVRVQFNTCETSQDKLRTLQDIENILDDIRKEIYQEWDKRTEAICL